MSTSTDEMLNVKQLAKRLGVSAVSIYRWRSEGQHDKMPPALMIGRQVRWQASTVEEWLRQREGANERPVW